MIARGKLLAFFAVLWALCLGLVACPLQPAFASEEAESQAIGYSDIDGYLQTCVARAHLPALSVTIVDKDDVLFSANYGQCESSDTPFLLGSVSKSFTAVCIMQLVEQQKIDLTAPIATYLPYATDGDVIMVSQLLNHTSGLGEHQTLDNYNIIGDQSVHTYANVNYSLLGEIIEAVSGESYADYLSNHVLKPLDLSHTAATLDESKQNGLIDGYTNYWGIPVQAEPRYPASQNAWITVPAGYLSSSANDLGKYLQMYLNGGRGTISEESIDIMFYGDTVFVDDDVPFWYGYGWATVKEPLPETVLRHSGLVETGTSCVFILPESDIAVALASNMNDYFVANEMMDSLGWGVVLMLLGEAPNEIPDDAYTAQHVGINLIMLVVFASALLPWCFLPRTAANIKRGRVRLEIVLLALVHGVLPLLILLIVPLFFKTPLWVAQAFVPDVFVTVVVSAALLLICGVIKAVMLYKQRQKARHIV